MTDEQKAFLDRNPHFRLIGAGGMTQAGGMTRGGHANAGALLPDGRFVPGKAALYPEIPVGVPRPPAPPMGGSFVRLRS